MPVEAESRSGILGELTPFPALVAREEDEAALVESFHQDHSYGGAAVSGCGRERRRLGQLDPGAPGFLEPGLELAKRIRVEVALAKRAGTGIGQGRYLRRV